MHNHTQSYTIHPTSPAHAPKSTVSLFQIHVCLPSSPSPHTFYLLTLHSILGGNNNNSLTSVSDTKRPQTPTTFTSCRQTRTAFFPPSPPPPIHPKLHSFISSIPGTNLPLLITLHPVTLFIRLLRPVPCASAVPSLNNNRGRPTVLFVGRHHDPFYTLSSALSAACFYRPDVSHSNHQTSTGHLVVLYDQSTA